MALGVIAGLLAAVTVLRWFFDGAGEAVALLYVVPITLGALRFGRRGGIGVAGIGMTAFIVLEAVRARGDLDLTGWAGPLLVMVLIMVGVPGEGIGLILGVDRILDMSRTVPNVTGDLLTSIYIAKREGYDLTAAGGAEKELA